MPTIVEKKRPNPVPAGEERYRKGSVSILINDI